MLRTALARAAVLAITSASIVSTTGCATTEGADPATPGAASVAEPASGDKPTVAEAVGTVVVDDPASAAIKLTFAWPVPSSAWVVEDQNVKGVATRSEYRVVVSAAGEQLKVAVTDLQPPTTPDGQALDDSTQRMFDALHRATAGVLPSFLVNQQGDFVSVSDLDVIIDATVASMAELSDEERAMAAKNLRYPQMRTLMEQRLASSGTGGPASSPAPSWCPVSNRWARTPPGARPSRSPSTTTRSSPWRFSTPSTPSSSSPR